MFSVVSEAPYKANVSDNLGSDVVLGVSLVSGWVFVGAIKTKKYFPIFHSNTKLCPAAWEVQSGRPVWL